MNQATEQTPSDFDLIIEVMLDFVVKLNKRHIDIADVSQYYNELNSAKLKLYNINLDNLTDADKERHAYLKAKLLREIDISNTLASSAVAESVNMLRAEPINPLLEK